MILTPFFLQYIECQIYTMVYSYLLSIPVSSALLFLSFFAYYFLKLHLYNSSKIRNIKKTLRSQATVELYLLDDGKIRIRILILIHTSG